MHLKTPINKKYADPRPLAERLMSVPSDCVEATSATRSVTVNLGESPLSWLHSRGHLTDRQLLAGEKLRGDYESSSLGPRVTMRWERTSRSQGRRGAPDFADQTERMLSAKTRFDAALKVLGPDLCDIAWRVICAGESLPVAERQMVWPARSGKLVLRIALDRLAGYYRVPG